jgi:hypothetical protein
VTLETDVILCGTKDNQVFVFVIKIPLINDISVLPFNLVRSFVACQRVDSVNGLEKEWIIRELLDGEESRIVFNGPEESVAGCGF